MDNENSIPQDVGATQSDAPIANVDNRTEDQMLADILRASPIAKEAGLESLPEEQESPTNPEEKADDDQESPEVNEEEVIEETPEGTEESGDDTSTEAPEVYSLEDLDDIQITHKIDGEEVTMPLSDWVKGSATNQSLSNKGRELGDARKKFDSERTEKLNQIDGVLEAANTILGKAETDHAKEYHSFTDKIKEARNDGDSLLVSELKDKQDIAKEKYFAAKSEKDKLLETAKSQKAEVEQKAFQEKLETFSKNINTVIPDWSEDVAKDIRSFAIERKIPEDIINSMVDVNVIKMVDDLRRLEKAKAKGVVKRKAAPIKATPVKKSNTLEQKAQIANATLRENVLSGNASKSDQDAFLKGLVSRHFE